MDDKRNTLNGLPPDLWRTWTAGTMSYTEAAREAMRRELQGERDKRREEELLVLLLAAADE